MMKYLVVALLAGFVAACVTPMTMSQVEDVTTCKQTTLKKIRKNLLLAGYEIEEQTSEDLVTEWKQTGGYEKNRSLDRITVVKVDDSTFRFKVMQRSVRVDRENIATVSTTSKSKKRRDSATTGISFGRDVDRTNDSEQRYYQEYETTYRQKQYEVCGR